MRNVRLKLYSLIMCSVICLLGVSYAGFTNSLSITKKVTTAKMDYVFSSDNKTLEVVFDSENSRMLLNMMQGDKYQIPYQLDSQDIENVPLKEINNKYLGSIPINLISINLQQSNDARSFFASYLPSTLGTFSVYHDFKDSSGTITLVKDTEPEVANCSVNMSSISPEVQQQLGIYRPTEEEIIDESEDEEDTTGQTSPKTAMTISLEGTYGFSIPLHFDQFNTN